MTRDGWDDEGWLIMKIFTDLRHKLRKLLSVVPGSSRRMNKLVLLSFSSDFFFFAISVLASLFL